MNHKITVRYTEKQGGYSEILLLTMCIMGVLYVHKIFVLQVIGKFYEKHLISAHFHCKEFRIIVAAESFTTYIPIV